MDLLLTGATGFVGRNLLLHALVKRWYANIYVPVRNPDKLTNQLKDEGFPSIPENLKVIRTEAPHWTFERLRVDHVIHSAAVLFARTREEYEVVNVEGTLSLLERLENPSRVVLISSQSAAGPSARQTPIRRESDPEAPVSWYGKSKLRMERAVSERWPRLPYVVLRPPMVLGPRDQAFLPLFKMVHQPVRFKPGLSKNLYSFISVDDLVEAVFHALQMTEDWSGLPQRHFFVGNAHPVSDREMIHTAAHIVGKRGVVAPVPQVALQLVSWIIDAVPAWRKEVPSLSKDKLKEMRYDRWVVSSDAFDRCFGWRAHKGLREALEETYQWYLKTGLIHRNAD